MKKIKIFALSIVAILGLTAAIFAFGTVVFNKNVSAKSATSCCADETCCTGGTCRMNGECCANQDSCPMKTGQTQTPTNPAFDTSRVVVEAGEQSCCKGKMKMK